MLKLAAVGSIPPAYEALKQELKGLLRAQRESIPPAYEALKQDGDEGQAVEIRVDPARLRGIETFDVWVVIFMAISRSRPPTRH